MVTADKGYMRAEGTFHIPGLAVRCRLCVCLLLLFFVWFGPTNPVTRLLQFFL